MSTFTLFHVALSLIGIISGLIMLFGLLSNRRMPGVTAIFFITTVATSVTGFCYFPFLGFTPGQAFGILSMVLLMLALYGRYFCSMAGPWRVTFVITAVAALYLNFFVLIVQTFQKIPALKPAVAGQTSPYFMVAQVTAFVLFVAAGYAAIKRFKGADSR